MLVLGLGLVLVLAFVLNSPHLKQTCVLAPALVGGVVSDGVVMGEGWC